MEECVVYIYKNYSILLIECEDLEESFNKLGENEASQKWNEVVLPMFAGTPKFDGSEKQEPCKKIFDLKQQLEEGKLEQY
jgi:L-rhamnose mutarotase